MTAAHQVIHIHPEAPPKPPEGAPCNGCGVCCLAEPCPVGMLISRKRHGACDLLRWSDTQARYVCGLLADGDEGRVDAGDSPGAPWRRAWRGLWRAWARRLISAGSGCDASLEVGVGGGSPVDVRIDPHATRQK